MATNPFDNAVNVNNNINRSNHDWRHANNFSTKLGQITPVFAEVVPNASSMKIDPQYLLKLMPMGFPVQTQMKARLSFFKIPLRILWKDYMDYIGNFRGDLVEPYHDVKSQAMFNQMFKTGKIMDYLGVPTTRFGEYGSQKTISYPGTQSKVPTPSDAEGTPIFHAQLSRRNIADELLTSTPYWLAAGESLLGDPPIDPDSLPMHDYRQPFFNVTDYFPDRALPVFSFGAITFPIPPSITVAKSGEFNIRMYMNKTAVQAFHNMLDPNLTTSSFSLRFSDENMNIIQVLHATPTFIGNSVTIEPSVNNLYEVNIPVSNLVDTSNLRYISILIDPYYYQRHPLFDDHGNPQFATQLSVPADVLPEDITRDTMPWYDSNNPNCENQIKLSAYMARAYECVYNCYYRDNRNNPYILDGQEQYNKFLPTLDGGADPNIYPLRFANYEKDFLTTAVRSPQQGLAPLVGLTTYTEDEIIKNDKGLNEIRSTQKVAIVDEDGQAYGVSFDSDSEGLNNVEYTPLSNLDNMSNARSLVDVASTGISITDLRNVNAYQKFLELNMRKGYMYRDIIQGRWNVSVRYNDLLMPEFIGGSTREISVSPVTQSIMRSDSGNYEDALGSQAGLGSCYGDAENISVYCEEESIVLGLLTVVPIPVYTQLLPKHFTYRNLLDHFQPEFAHIGYQPITYKEVCPIQAYSADPVNGLSKTFGYNRAWYEFVQKYDTAHGDFRLNLRNFLVHREFNVAPELSEEFLLINPEHVNNVFAVTENTDKIFGQIYFQVSAKLPVPKVVIPRLD